MNKKCLLELYQLRCIHLVEQGQEQLKKDLYRYRCKEAIIQLIECADNYSASDEWLHCKLFAEKTDSIRLIWEYTNMMLFNCGGEGYREKFPNENSTFLKLSEFYKVNGILSYLKKNKSLVYSEK